MNLSTDNVQHFVELVEFLQALSTRTIKIRHESPCLCHASRQLTSAMTRARKRAALTSVSVDRTDGLDLQTALLESLALRGRLQIFSAEGAAAVHHLKVVRAGLH